MRHVIFFFQAEDGIRDLVRSRGLGDVYKRQGKGFFLEDLKSTNGTLLNGKKVNALSRIKKGDRVQIGRSVFEVIR